MWLLWVMGLAMTNCELYDSPWVIMTCHDSRMQCCASVQNAMLYYIIQNAMLYCSLYLTCSLESGVFYLVYWCTLVRCAQVCHPHFQCFTVPKNSSQITSFRKFLCKSRPRCAKIFFSVYSMSNRVVLLCSNLNNFLLKSTYICMFSDTLNKKIGGPPQNALYCSKALSIEPRIIHTYCIWDKCKTTRKCRYEYK